MPKPICVKCMRFFKPKKTGIVALEQMPKKNDALPGDGDQANWTPSKCWSADLYSCKGCGAEIIYGFGLGPIAEHHEIDFYKIMALAKYVVNDC